MQMPDLNQQVQFVYYNHIFVDNFFYHFGIADWRTNCTVFDDIVTHIYLYEENFSMYFI